MAENSVHAIVRDVIAGDRSAMAIAGDALERADAYDAIQPQAWIARVPAQTVLAQARRLDTRVAAGEALPLAGVPFVVKDNIDVAGLPTTAACPAFAYTPQASATVVRRLVEAGALLLGKTNLDQFATGLVGTRSPYGAPGCVFNRAYISGGSSSGSAVLVGAGIASFALGTDTAGSGRVPAAINGLVGLKPTRGRWSTHGVFPACRSLDCVSVFTADVRDAGILDEVLTAFDDADPYSRAAPGRPAGAADARPPTGARATPAPVRLGVPRQDQLEFFGDAESACFHAAAIDRLASTGASCVEVDIAPLLAAAQLLYAGPWVAERAAALGAFLRDRPGAIHPVVRGIVQGGLSVSGVDTFRGMYALQEHLRAAAALWQQVDVLALPTAPTVYRIGEVLADPVALNSNLGYYTNFVNLLDMSALSLPAGFRTNGTGYGVSLIGPAWADTTLLALGQRFERAPGAAARPPLDRAERAPGVRLAVVGAHLSGMPLHWQLSSRAARLAATTRTAPLYRLYAMAGQTPPKPALAHVGAAGGGHAIEVEVYELDEGSFGSFVAEVPPPLAIGTVTLADGSTVKGFVAEPRALDGAIDVSAAGGWRAHLAATRSA
jgi:allophanate hydrolase